MKISMRQISDKIDTQRAEFRTKIDGILKKNRHFFERFDFLEKNRPFGVGPFKHSPSLAFDLLSRSRDLRQLRAESGAE